MILPGRTNSKFIFFSIAIVMIMISIRVGEAKRGCAAFGHSCYGGHGKRSDSTFTIPDEISNIFKLPANDVSEIFNNEEHRAPYEAKDLDNNDFALILPFRVKNSERFSPLFWKLLMNSYKGYDLQEMKK